MSHHKEHIVRSSIVTAFTIAAALIWKDVFTEAVDRFIPPGDHLAAQFVSAAIATTLIIVSLKAFLSGEEKAEEMVEHMLENHDHDEHHKK